MKCGLRLSHIVLIRCQPIDRSHVSSSIGLILGEASEKGRLWTYTIITEVSSYNPSRMSYHEARE
jgi:hypothetical protein